MIHISVLNHPPPSSGYQSYCQNTRRHKQIRKRTRLCVKIWRQRLYCLAKVWLGLEKTGCNTGVWSFICNWVNQQKQKEHWFLCELHAFLRCAVCRRALWCAHTLSEITLNVNKPQRGRPWQGGCFETVGTSLWFTHSHACTQLSSSNPWLQILLRLTDRWPFSGLLFTRCSHKHRLLTWSRFCPALFRKRVMDMLWLVDGWAWRF